MAFQCDHPRISIFDPKEAVEYINRSAQDQEFQKFARYNFELNWKLFYELEAKDVELLASKSNDPDLKQLFDHMVQDTKKDAAGDGSILMASTNDGISSTTMRKSCVLLAEMKNGRYDILVASAVQTKHLDWAKIATVGLGVSIIGGALAAAGLPVVSAISAMATGGTISLKAICDYNEEMPNALYGYIFQELKDKRLLSIDENKFVLSEEVGSMTQTDWNLQAKTQILRIHFCIELWKQNKHPNHRQ